MSQEQKRLLILFLVTGSLAAVLIAVWLPVSAVQYIRLQVVGYDLLAVAEVTVPQRVTAAIGGLLATLVLARLLWIPAASPLPAVRGSTLLVLSLVCLSLAGLSLYAKFSLTAYMFLAKFWDLPRPPLIPGLPRQVIMFLFLSVVGAIGLLGLSVTFLHLRKSRFPILPDGRGVASAVGAGAAYGCFSALWHCCDPIWDAPIHMASTILAMGCLLPTITALGMRWKPPVGETMGGILLGLIYPWHSLLWFTQMLFAGAFFIWISRRTGSVFATAIAVSVALIMHTTLPFLGWTGAAIAGVFLGIFLFWSCNEIGLRRGGLVA